MSTQSSKSKSTAPAASKVKRRSADGRIDPQYAKELLAKSGKSTNETDDKAFLAASRAGEELAEELGETFLEAATSGEESTAARADRVREADRGGPYVVTSDAQEFATGTDASNPEEATREPFPTT